MCRLLTVRSLFDPRVIVLCRLTQGGLLEGYQVCPPHGLPQCTAAPRQLGLGSERWAKSTLTSTHELGRRFV